MIGVPFAHVAGMPLEETLASFGPLLFVGFGLAWASFRSRLLPVRSRVSQTTVRQTRDRSEPGPARPGGE